MLAAIVGLAGASKLGLLPSAGKIGMGKSDVMQKAAMARKKAINAKGAALVGPRDKVIEGITKLKPSDIKGRNPKSIYAMPDGSLEKGLEKFKNKEIYAKTMRERRGRKSPLTTEGISKKTPGIFGFRFKEPLFNKGKMVKARGGGLAKGGMKPTKLY
tara:strand:+ start:1019 stop:1492 length:474 start_codon:yes stop_codon:yes gene_type:complete